MSYSLLCSSGSFSSLLYGWQQQSDQNRDDRNDHQQLDQCKTSTTNPHDSLLKKNEQQTLRGTGLVIDCQVTPDQRRTQSLKCGMESSVSRRAIAASVTFLITTPFLLQRMCQ
jgi:hypothetical protein